MPSLPLKVQVAIRDRWQNPDGALQKALRDLQDLLGHSIAVDPEWNLILVELGETYADKERLVVAVTGAVQVWATSMKELLDDEANEGWADNVLEKTANAGGRLWVFLEVAASGRSCSTAWSESRQGFIIALPKEDIQPTALFPVFRGQLLGAFDAAKAKKETVPLDWADVEVDDATGAAAVVDRPAPVVVSGKTATKSEYFPTLESLPRPDELLLKPPYHMVVYASGHNNVEVQGSHSPSLKLLADYLKRWCRVNHNDTRSPPAVDVKLHQSAFGLSEMFDRVVISTENNRYTTQFHVTAPIVLSFIEGVLGYERASERPGTWSFRREDAFKIL